MNKFKCITCDKSFARLNGLKRHENYHGHGNTTIAPNIPSDCVSK